ncbi:hypothetical protein Anapl_14915 [Anas platyrhynchos]|uniref:Uncharacterized protein n=1 Tax=Anas platyrhynchos TaxID=8839 RepID=R0LNG9_ANAPL|nr:hypothetical protein Anapl_14915 [Anas platyrhynchos]
MTERHRWSKSDLQIKLIKSRSPGFLLSSQWIRVPALCPLAAQITEFGEGEGVTEATKKRVLIPDLLGAVMLLSSFNLKPLRNIGQLNNNHHHHHPFCRKMACQSKEKRTVCSWLETSLFKSKKVNILTGYIELELQNPLFQPSEPQHVPQRAVEQCNQCLHQCSQRPSADTGRQRAKPEHDCPYGEHGQQCVEKAPSLVEAGLYLQGSKEQSPLSSFRMPSRMLQQLPNPHPALLQDGLDLIFHSEQRSGRSHTGRAMKHVKAQQAIKRTEGGITNTKVIRKTEMQCTGLSTKRTASTQGEGSFFQAHAHHPQAHKSFITSLQVVAQTEQQLATSQQQGPDSTLGEIWGCSSLKGYRGEALRHTLSRVRRWYKIDCGQATTGCAAIISIHKEAKMNYPVDFLIYAEKLTSRTTIQHCQSNMQGNVPIFNTELAEEGKPTLYHDDINQGLRKEKCFERLAKFLINVAPQNSPPPASAAPSRHRQGSSLPHQSPPRNEGSASCHKQWLRTEIPDTFITNLQPGETQTTALMSSPPQSRKHLLRTKPVNSLLTLQSETRHTC